MKFNLLLLLLLTTSASLSGKSLAKILKVEGGVYRFSRPQKTYQRSADQNEAIVHTADLFWRETVLREGDFLMAQDMVRTSQKDSYEGRVRLSLSDGPELVVAPGSEVLVGERQGANRHGPMERFVHLVKGEILVFTRSQEAGDKWRFYTRSLVLANRLGDFSLTHDYRHSVVISLGGEQAVRDVTEGSQKQVTLRRGLRTQVRTPPNATELLALKRDLGPRDYGSLIQSLSPSSPEQVETREILPLAKLGQGILRDDHQAELKTLSSDLRDELVPLVSFELGYMRDQMRQTLAAGDSKALASDGLVVQAQFAPWLSSLSLGIRYRQHHFSRESFGAAASLDELGLALRWIYSNLPYVNLDGELIVLNPAEIKIDTSASAVPPKLAAGGSFTLGISLRLAHWLRFRLAGGYQARKIEVDGDEERAYAGFEGIFGLQFEI